MKRILFIGLGNMGLPMAMNLLKAGFAVEEATMFFEERGGDAQ